MKKGLIVVGLIALLAMSAFVGGGDCAPSQ